MKVVYFGWMEEIGMSNLMAPFLLSIQVYCLAKKIIELQSIFIITLHLHY